MDRVNASNSAILVGLDSSSATHKDSLQELEQLAISAKLQVLAVVEGKRSRPDPTTYIGSGKVDEIAQLISLNKASLVIFNHDLSPAQQRSIKNNQMLLHYALHFRKET